MSVHTTQPAGRSRPGPFPNAELAEPLSHEEEVQLGLKSRAGDLAARNRLVESNLRLVVKIARDFEGRGLPLEDLVAEGTLGLISAAQAFEPKFEVKFGTYAAYWIRQALHVALMNVAPTIRLPAYMVQLLRCWRRAERSLHLRLGYPPRPEQVSAELKLTPRRFSMVQAALRTRHVAATEDLQQNSQPDLTEAVDTQLSPYQQVEQQDQYDEALRRLDRLTERQRTVVSLRLGLAGGEAHTLKEAGERLGLSREQVRKIELSAFQVLRDQAASRPS